MLMKELTVSDASNAGTVTYHPVWLWSGMTAERANLPP